MSPPQKPLNVSSRESQILHLAAEGRTDKEIAALLGISRDTVGTYWKRIRRRLGGSSRTEAVARALRQEASDAMNEYVVENERLLYEMAERNRAEEDRARLVVRLESLIDGVHSGVLLEDEECRIVYLNRAMHEMMGADSDIPSLIGSDGWARSALMEPLFLPGTRFCDRTLAIVQSGRRVVGEVLRMADGRVFERDYTPIRSKRGLDGHLWQYRNITALRTAMDTLESKSAFDDLVAALSTEVLSCDPNVVDATVVRALEAVGRHLQADRVYVLLLSSDDAVMSVAYEWLAPGVSSTLPYYASIAVEGLGDAIDVLRAGKHIALTTVDESATITDFAKGLLEKTGTQSLLVVPLTFEGRLRGCISFAHVQGIRPWTETEVALLRLVGVSINSALARAQRLNA